MSPTTTFFSHLDAWCHISAECVAIKSVAFDPRPSQTDTSLVIMGACSSFVSCVLCRPPGPEIVSLHPPGLALIRKRVQPSTALVCVCLRNVAAAGRRPGGSVVVTGSQDFPSLIVTVVVFFVICYFSRLTINLYRAGR